MTTELLSLNSINSINNAIQATKAGDYDRATKVNVRLLRGIRYQYTSASGTTYKPHTTTLLEAIGKLSRLTILEISPVVSDSSLVRRSRRSSEDNCDVPVAAVAAALKRAPSLESLSLWNVRLYGTSEEYLWLAEAFQGHTKLKVFCLKCSWRFYDMSRKYGLLDGVEETTLRNAVLASLGSIPSLEKLHLETANGDEMRDVSLLSFLSLAQSKSLKSLHIVPCVLSDEAMTMVSAVLNDGVVATLKKLSLCCASLGLNGCEGLVKLLSNPRSQLCELRLVVSGAKSSVDAKELIRKLTNALGNSTCMTIRFGVPYLHRAFALDGIKAMLRRNYRVQSMQVDAPWRPVWSPVKNKEIEFLVKTNKLGRGSLLLHDPTSSRPSPPCTWMTLVEATEKKIDNIYCLVSSHLDEFVRMGLHCSAEDKAPTVGNVKTLLHRTKRDFPRSFDGQELNPKGLLQARNKAITDSSNALDESKLDGLYSKTQMYMDNIFETHKQGMEKLLFKTEERIMAKLGNDGNALEDEPHAAKSDERIEDGALHSKTAEGTEDCIEKALANVASDDKHKDGKSATITANSNHEASWSKSKKKRMRRLRAKQKNQSAKKDEDNLAKKDAP